MNDSIAACILGSLQYALTLIPLDPESEKRAEDSNDSQPALTGHHGRLIASLRIEVLDL